MAVLQMITWWRYTVEAATADNAAHSLPPLELTRGARHLTVLAGGRKLMFLQGEIQHRNLWMVDLETGAVQQLTHMPGDFDVRDFDISPMVARPSLSARKRVRMS